MKRQSFILFLSSIILLFAVNSASGEGNLKVGVDMAGVHKTSMAGINILDDVDIGLSITTEFLSPINDNTDMGVGIELQLPRSLKDFDGSFFFVPLYGVIRIQPALNDISPYLTGRMGYNFFMGDNDYKAGASLKEACITE
ncbi:MAG: hypothetical protein ACE5EA_11460 [Nitrospirota bacterium]